MFFHSVRVCMANSIPQKKQQTKCTTFKGLSKEAKAENKLICSGADWQHAVRHGNLPPMKDYDFLFGPIADVAAFFPRRQ